MAEGKKSVLLYCDLIHTIEKMDDETAGKFFKHYLRYINDLNPVAENIIIDLTFEPVKQNLKRDLSKWESRADNSRNNGKLGGRPKKEETQKTQQVISKPKKPVKVTVNVTDNVNVTDKNIFSFRKSLCVYGFDEKLIDEWLQVRKSKKSVNTETALNTFIKEVEKSNLPKNQILEMCVSNSWAGFKNEWLTNKNGNNGNTKTADERLQEAKSRILGEDSEFSESKPNNENLEFTSYEDVGKF